MAVLEEALLSYLTGYAGLTALISDRVYFMRIPQGATLPCVTFQRISTQRETTMQSSGATGDLARPRFQFDVWGTTAAAVKPITDQIRAALNGKTGTIGSGAYVLTIRAALVDNEDDEYNPEVNLYRSRSEYVIWHEE